MDKTYTLGRDGRPDQADLTLEEIGEIILTDDNYWYEVRCTGRNEWTLFTSRSSRNAYGNDGSMVSTVLVVYRTIGRARAEKKLLEMAALNSADLWDVKCDDEAAA